MIRQIIIPKKKTYQMEFPDSFIGKKIGLIAFEIGGEEIDTENNPLNAEDLFKRFEGLTFDGRGQYVFSREEATD